MPISVGVAQSEGNEQLALRVALGNVLTQLKIIVVQNNEAFGQTATERDVED